MQVNLPLSWQEILFQYFDTEQFQKTLNQVEDEYRHHTVYPAKHEIFNALNLVEYGEVKVCILGQDPYHGPNQANGLAFSVNPSQKIPPSLRNIFKELATDLNIPVPSHGDLTAWAKQGVLLLNTVLTVRAGQANSHRQLGWEAFTDEIIKQLNRQDKPIVFILWGKNAQSKKIMIDESKHRIIESPHPSPLSSYRGFFGSKPFSQTNQQLQEWGIKPIDWHLP
ncbi:uracil-DNA glycosylase [Aerococcaceae bacterium DSM 111020]|nr:uracil-DNA glycosylase [Aerococcaceae bacterium DSM 111020]